MMRKAVSMQMSRREPRSIATTGSSIFRSLPRANGTRSDEPHMDPGYRTVRLAPFYRRTRRWAETDHWEGGLVFRVVASWTLFLRALAALQVRGRGVRTMSAAARRKIAASQKARWAKWRRMNKR